MNHITKKMFIYFQIPNAWYRVSLWKVPGLAHSETLVPWGIDGKAGLEFQSPTFSDPPLFPWQHENFKVQVSF